MNKEEILKYLPEGYEKACWETGAMSRKAGLQNEKDLLTLCLFYGYDHSLKETECYAKTAGIYEISDVGFMKRFSRCSRWFEWMTERIKPSQLLAYEKPEQLEKYRVLAVDASTVVSGGKMGLRWHLHYAVNLFTLNTAMFQLTGEETGETLKNYEFQENDLVLGDRIYATKRGIEYCMNCHADFVLRIRNKAFQLYTETGDKISFTQLLKGIDSEYGDFKVYFKGEDKQMHSIRICAVKKSEEAFLHTQKRTARKESKKQVRYSDDTKFSSRYFFVVTSLEEEFSAEQILTLYRLRWQVELVFKRYKSILHLGSMPVKTKASCETWLHCKMLLALLIEKMLSEGDFSPSAAERQKLVERNETPVYFDFNCFFSY